MDDGCTQSPPPETRNPTAGSAGGPSDFLANLPSRGLFSSTVLPSNPGGMRVYVCDHDTSPPEDQLIKTNQTNILIRSLMLKNQKGNSCLKVGKGIAASLGSRKRTAERALDGKAAGKRAMPSTHVGSSSEEAVTHLQSLTVERLRAHLREKGLSLKGKKDELIARLKGADG